MATKVCANCQSVVPKLANFCNICGKNQFEEVASCPFCNTSLPNKDVKFCPSCGKRISKKSTKTKIILSPVGEIHQCGICRLNIESDFTVCPSCLNPFHFPHLANWIVEKKECPMCKTNLIFET